MTTGIKYCCTKSVEKARPVVSKICQERFVEGIDDQLAFVTADFPAIFGTLPLPRLRVSAPRNTTF
jgi:hypothetical protein